MTNQSNPAVHLLFLIKVLPITISKYPEYLEKRLQIAENLKRSGKYIESIKEFSEVLKQEEMVHTEVLNGIFKVVAAAGYLKEAITMMQFGDTFLKRNNLVYYPFNLPNSFGVHIYWLKSVVDYEQSLFEYLKSISDNPNYVFPRKYIDMVKDYYAV